MTTDDKPAIEPVIRVADQPLVPRPDAWKPKGAAADKFDVARAALGARLGLGKLGVTVTQVAPGRTGYPFHSHYANDELFYILAGRGELRLGDQRHAVAAGDLVGCPTGGPQSAHQLVNTGDEPLKYLAISTLVDVDICHYPDSGKVGAFVDDDAGAFMHMSRTRDARDYWEGE